MYHPADGGAEFIEIQNVGTESVPLLGVHFAEAITFTFSDDATLAPGEFTVLVRDDDLPLFAFEHPTVPVGGLYEGRLDNGGELVILSNGAATSMFSFTYDDTAPWDTDADGQGYSLILIDPQGNPNTPSNWQASIPKGGTPGKPGGLDGQRAEEVGCGCECEGGGEGGGGGGGGGGGEGGSGGEGPVCLMISPTDAGPGDLVTLTGYDENGDFFDLGTLRIFESNFHGIGDPWYPLLKDGDDLTNIEIVDGTVVFELIEDMLSEDVEVWDFFCVPGGDDAAFRIAGGDGPFETVAEAIAEGGTCDLGPGGSGVPFCLTISPTDAGPGDEVTLTAFDENGEQVDLTEWTGGVETGFWDCDPSGIFQQADEDGTVTFELTDCSSI
jgi:hypothetical protein